MDQFEEKKWFVFLGDRHEGPFSFAEIQAQVDQKKVTISNFVWAEGMTDWKLMKEVPAFEEIRKKQEPARPTEAPVKMDSVPSMFKASSLALETQHRDARQVDPSIQIEKEWKRRKAFRVAVQLIFLTLLGCAGAYAYQYRAMIQNYAAQAMEKARPKLIVLSERYPALTKYISPIPGLEDVNDEDYSALRSAAATPLASGGPQVALALSRNEPAQPTFYVSSNLPSGARFDIYIEGVHNTLVGQMHASSRLKAGVENRLGKTSAAVLTDGKPLPMGEYQVSVFESDNEFQPAEVRTILGAVQPLNAAKTDLLPAGLKMLARKTYFLGGVKDDNYTKKLREYRDQLNAKAKVELADLKDISATLEKQIKLTMDRFKTIKKGRGITPARKKAWSTFHASWIKDEIALVDRFEKLTPEVLHNEYLFEDLYSMARETGQNLQKLHDLQNDFFESRVDDRAADIQVGTLESVAQSTLVAFKTKIEQTDTGGAK